MPIPAIAASTIAAQAFRDIELAPISSFDDGTEQAQAATEQYPLALQMVLEAADWSKASVYVTLSASVDAGTTDPTLPYFYVLPGDLISIQEVGDKGFTKWRQDKDGLRSDTAAPLSMRYTAMITNEASLPARLQRAISLQLAVLLGPRFLGTASKIDALEQKLARQMKLAMRHDARTASENRYDDTVDQGDWATEATR